MVGRIPMRMEPAKNRPYMSGKILPFWIGHCSALSSVLSEDESITLDNEPQHVMYSVRRAIRRPTFA